MGPELAVVAFGLAAGVSWGVADFGGGLAARRMPAFGAVLGSQAVGLIGALVAAGVLGEPVPGAADVAWAAAAGCFGGTGLVAFYHGLATGRMGIVAPVTGVLTAAIPVTAGLALEGLPGPARLAGLGLGFAAMVLVSASAERGGGPSGLGAALVAGCGFGLFVLLISRVADGLVFWPVVAARSGSIALVTAIVLAGRRPWRAPVRLVPGLALVGLLDVAGNAFFLLSSQAGELAVAALLSSLYPVVTVVLAALVVRERITPVHALGIAAAAAAVGLIAVG